MEGWEEILSYKTNNALQLYFVGENPILMQYTGLKDKNGKEIYEGDIIVEYLLPNEYDYGIIEYLDGSFVINWKSKMWQYLINVSRREVIGNIYENPELLK